MSTITEQTQIVGERIAAQSCILEIHVRQPGFRKKINSDTFLHINGNNGEISSDVLSVSKDILERGDIDYLQTHRNAFIKKLKGYSIQAGGLALGNGQYLMPLSLVEQIKIDIEAYKSERAILIDKFEAAYEELKLKAQSKLGKFYNSNDYPQFRLIRSKYSVDHRFISNSVPEELKKLSDALFKSEKARRQKELETAAKDIEQIMRQTFLELITHFSERLGRDSQTGKFSNLPEARLTDLLEFVNTFGNKNIIGDENLGEIIKKAQSTLQGLGIRELKSNEELRDKVTIEMDKIKSSTETLIKTQTRAIKI